MSHHPGGPHPAIPARSGSNNALAATRSNPRARSGLTWEATPWVRMAVATLYADQRVRSALWLASTSALARSRSRGPVGDPPRDSSCLFGFLVV